LKDSVVVYDVGGGGKILPPFMGGGGIGFIPGGPGGGIPIGGGGNPRGGGGRPIGAGGRPIVGGGEIIPGIRGGGIGGLKGDFYSSGEDIPLLFLNAPTSC
jgi:hypothetical protein